MAYDTTNIISHTINNSTIINVINITAIINPSNSASYRIITLSFNLAFIVWIKNIFYILAYYSAKIITITRNIPIIKAVLYATIIISDNSTCSRIITFTCNCTIIIRITDHTAVIIIAGNTANTCTCISFIIDWAAIMCISYSSFIITDNAANIGTIILTAYFHSNIENIFQWPKIFPCNAADAPTTGISIISYASTLQSQIMHKGICIQDIK